MANSWEENSLQIDLQHAGCLRQRWIADPGESCPVRKSILTLKELENKGWTKSELVGGVPYGFEEQAQILGLPFEISFNDTGPYKRVCLKKQKEGQLIEAAIWEGRYGHGAVYIEDIQKEYYGEGPWMSEITLAACEKDLDISSLRYVFVSDIVNVKTKDYFIKVLYKDSHGWLDLRSWEYGTPEYQALLGTPIGKIVAGVVLAAFDRGTRRIARVITWPLGFSDRMNMEFDIEVRES